MNYDEEAVLTRYVWDHYTALMSDLERRVEYAIVGREKVKAVGDTALSSVLAQRWGLVEDAEVEAALAGGRDAYRRSVCRRLLRDRAADVFVNRCPRCRRVVRTPTARQCLWCGNDWHAP